MSGVIVTGPPRADARDIEALAAYGVATVSEAMGRTGLIGPELRPVQQGVRIAGSAVTVLSWPGDNLMIHAAVEQCGEGDVLVVTTTSPSTDGMFGELFATALRRRGVRGLVINAGVRDTQELRDMGFAVWAKAVSAQGTVKATGGSVNVPVAIGGQVIRPGDVVVADDDGVVVVPRERVRRTAEASEAREAKEAEARAAFLEGQLGLDRYGLREKLEALGVRYATYEEHEKHEEHERREESEAHGERDGHAGKDEA
ncbi:4-carboxy-4-hydroxy-2-oxoadipate aldolase/oxaloacetate decarboxylase [Streptomyces sp. NBC_01012]|uniref:4-carboxy-4-hydroxy-2-oxoadipate aldolase/oxaloacetate decarboxylase n=1 Tax=Streptomyces sp. NBC_01012 TaxID=2903717 RepID=UPI003867C0EE|nr:4-carboxy-4-hydroxy-2-oxoadipate aldolase/oxaloacetate decarboxylase [Streptomyces sp. NBC_01012]